MIGILIVAHSGLAEALLAATEHVVGAVPAARAIGLGPADDLATRRQEIAAAAAELDQGDGVVIVTDLFGGTPANLAIAVMASGPIDVITGANLPLLMKLCSVRAQPRRDAVREAVVAGRKYIMDAESVERGASPPATET